MIDRIKGLKKYKGFIGILVLLLGTFVYAMFQGGFVSWFLFYLIVPLSLYSLLLFFYPLSKLEAERIIETRKVYSGGRFSATIKVTRNNRFPLLFVWFEEKVGPSLLHTGSRRQLVFWGIKKEFTWTYEIEHMPRGEHVLEGTKIEISDLFGWMKKSVFISNPKTLLVFPNLTDMIYIPMETRYDQGAAASRIQVMKDTTMATGVRSYQPGDRVSWIHWKSFARTQTLKTKEFEDRQSQDLFILIDRTLTPMFEDVVDLAASIMQAIVRHQASSAFLSLGEDRFFLPNVENEAQLHQVLYHLTKVQPDLNKPMEQVISQEPALAQATSLLYITSELTHEWIDGINRNAGNLRLCRCFVVKNKNEKPSKNETTLYQYAKSRGVDAHNITKDRFAQAFMEVNRS